MQWSGTNVPSVAGLCKGGRRDVVLERCQEIELVWNVAYSEAVCNYNIGRQSRWLRFQCSDGIDKPKSSETVQRLLLKDFALPEMLMV